MQQQVTLKSVAWYFYGLGFGTTTSFGVFSYER